MSLYDLLKGVSVEKLSTTFLCASNLFAKSGNFDKSVVSSQKSLEAAYRCVETIIKHVDKTQSEGTNDSSTENFVVLTEEGLKSPEVIKRSALGFTFIPHAPF